MMPTRHFILVQILLLAVSVVHAWVPLPQARRPASVALQSSAETTSAAAADYEIPDDAVITIKPKAMKRLQELRKVEGLEENEPLVLRMGVRSGGCSGM